MTVDEILSDLNARFPRQRETLKSWVSSFKRKLENVQPDKLGEAYRKIIDDWSDPSFPRPADIVKGLNLAHDGHPPVVKRDPGEDWATRVMQSPDGQAALRDGYGRELYLWAKSHDGLFPRRDELMACAEAERSFRIQLGEHLGRCRAAKRNLAEPVAPLMLKAVSQTALAMDALENDLKRRFYREAA